MKKEPAPAMDAAHNFIDLTNQRFDRLIVLRRAEKDELSESQRKQTSTYWLCYCDCGNQPMVSSIRLRKGHTKSCGLGCRKPKTNEINHLGKRYGRLSVISREGVHKYGSITWNCMCDCGTKCVKTSHALMSGTESCGCIDKEILATAAKTHGLYGTIIYDLWSGAKFRAKKQGIIFDLDVEEMPDIPQFCPVLGIPLMKNVGGKTSHDASPSLDRIVPSLGYVKGNVKIISQRANVIKNEGTAEEHMKIAEYIKSNVNNEENSL